MMKQQLTFLLLLTLAGSLTGQSPFHFQLLQEAIPPNREGTQQIIDFRGPQNNSLEETLNATFDSITAISPLKGFQAAAILPDGSIWKRASGLASSTPGDSVTTGHAMGIGSTTKTFTAITILLLQEAGLLDIDDSISMYLPPYDLIDPNITIRQLLQHTSGLYNYTEHPSFGAIIFSNPSYVWTPVEVLETFILPPLFTPGTDWYYSNTNYLLAGMIIEAVTGQSYYEVVRERILVPHGLQHTYGYPQEQSGQLFANVWLDVDGNGSVEVMQDFLSLESFFSAAYSAGALVSTPEDVAMLFRKLLNQEILEPSSYNDMFFVYPLEPTGMFGYGLGIFNGWNCNEMSWGHNGYILYQSENVTLPGEDLTVSVLSNDGRNETSLVGVNDLINALTNTVCQYVPVQVDPLSDVDFQYFPNPVSEVLFVQLPEPGEYTLKLVDFRGNILLQKATTGESISLDMRFLPSGVYLLSCQGNSRLPIQRLLIKQP